jgi:hypothetical protein
MNEVKVGSYVGAGAAKNIELGWVPAAVLIFNITDGTIVSFGFPGIMAAASAISIVAAAGPVLDATNQVSAYNGDATHGPGFTAGTDIAANAKTYAYIAVRSADPRTQTAGVASGASA